MLIQTENLSFSYGVDEILKDTRFRLDEKERVGIVGRNGSGKSTFLKLLSGSLSPDQGEINKRSDLTVGYLEQKPDFGEMTLGEVFTSVFDEVREKEKDLEALGVKIGQAEGDEQERLLREFGNLQEYLERVDVYSSESRIRGIVSGLKFSEEDLLKPFASLSGGEKTRAALGRLLLSSPDVLLLDEPTNYLDIDTLSWLEGLLKSYEGSIVLVSHDRYFLNAVATRIVDVENKTMVSYPGNYKNYVAKKEARRMEEDQKYALAMAELKRQQQIIRRFRDINSIKSSKRARSREIALSKMEMPEKREAEGEIHFDFTPKVRSGEEVLEAEDLKKSFGGRTLFEHVNLKIMRGDRIGIIGPNGVGKTTLFNILRRTEPKDSGRIRYGRRVMPGYYDQEGRTLRGYEDHTLIEALRGEDASMTDAKARSILASFLFTGEDVFKKVGDLSGGERARLTLAKLMLSEANFLLMDEPTNHIDMSTKEILEDVLGAYQGTLLFISHDRYFLNKIADKIIVLGEEGASEYLGNYDDYISQLRDREEREALLKAPEAGKTKTQVRADRKAQKALKAEQSRLRRAVRETEEAVAENEEKQRALEEAMCLPDFYDNPEQAEETLSSYQSLKEEADRLTESWEEAALLLEAFEEENPDLSI